MKRLSGVFSSLRAGAFVRVAAACALVAISACGPSSVFTPSGAELIPSPAPTEVESVLFFLGDPGDAHEATSPLLHRLRADIESWSEALESDSSVAVVVLGDILYPVGLEGPGSSTYDADTAVIMSQVRLVGGPWGLARSARGFSLAGNHDWGLRENYEGFVRLATLDTFLSSAAAATGALVELVPDAGTGGPVVLDLGEQHRLLLLDTAWWLVAATATDRQSVLRAVDEAFASAGDREVLIAAHHPFKSGGPHGGAFSFWETLGVRYLLYRSGAILQDVSSRPYRELEVGLRSIFERHGRPLAFIGGHEHSLQVIEATEPSDPEYSLVSGSGSKNSAVGPLDGLVFGQSAPGYMRLVLERGGGVSVFVEAAPPEYLNCPGAEPDRKTCMAEGLASFQTVFSRRLR